MQIEQQQVERRNAIMRILRGGVVRRQGDLVRLLKSEGYEATQSSISRDLRDLGVLKASNRYILPPDEDAAAAGNFTALARFVRQIRAAGPFTLVVRTTVGAAQSVAVAIDRAQWSEVVGTLSGDDTIFVATDDASAQSRLIERLRTLFRV